MFVRRNDESAEPLDDRRQVTVGKKALDKCVLTTLLRVPSKPYAKVIKWGG